MTKKEKQARDRKLIPKQPWPKRPQEEEVLSSRTFRAGYRVETVLVDCLEYMGKPFKKYAQRPGRFMIMRNAVTVEDGHYIGDSKWARRLFVGRKLRGVQPQKGGGTCCIGYCPRSERWFGWSHRAICGFGIGAKLFDPDWKPKKNTTEDEMDQLAFVVRGGRTIRNLGQAKKAALAFAAYVS